MPISDHSRKDKEILVTAKQGTALDKRRQRSPETGFPVDFHWTKVAIASCKPGLSLNFVVWVHICHNITDRRCTDTAVELGWLRWWEVFLMHETSPIFSRARQVDLCSDCQVPWQGWPT